jgi:hypothetical protein
MAREDRDRGRDRDRDRDREDTRSRRRDRDDDDGGDGELVTASLHSKDAVVGGGTFGPGRATIVTARFSRFDYRKKNGTRPNLQTVLLVIYNRDDEEERVPYGVGKGWTPGPKGESLVGRNKSSAGLSDNCNAMIFLKSFEDVGMPGDWLSSPKQLDGLDVDLIAKPVERDFADSDQGRGGVKKSAVLTIGEVFDPPWEATGKGKAKKKPVARDEDEDTDDTRDEDEDDEDERPAKGKGKGKGKIAPPDDDDDDDAPAPKPAARGAAHSTSRGNGSDSTRAKDRDADRERASKRQAKDEDTDSLDEETVEAVIEALADGPLKIDALETKIRTLLKGNPQRIAIAARATEEDLLALERGWSFNQRKGLVALD